MGGKLILKTIILLYLFSGEITKAKATNFLDCEILYELFNRKELIRFYHLDIHFKDSFIVVDANHNFPNFCLKNVQNRSIIISREIIDKKIKTKPIPLKFEIECVKRKGRLYVVYFRYDYEGLVGEAYFTRKNRLKKIIAWER